MADSLTKSETCFEQWCGEHGIRFRRIWVARVQGHKRPDYGIDAGFGWCVVEIKQLDSIQEDDAFPSRGGSFVEAGRRLRKPIRSAAVQLKRFSLRKLPTVICLFDDTASSHTHRAHVVQAMFGREMLRFVVADEGAATHSGTRYGKNATLTHSDNTSVSAIAVMTLRHDSGLVVDLYHNPHARVPIACDAISMLVRGQYPKSGAAEKTVLDMMGTAEWLEWAEDPDGMCERETRECLESIRPNNR